MYYTTTASAIYIMIVTSAIYIMIDFYMYHLEINNVELNRYKPV